MNVFVRRSPCVSSSGPRGPTGFNGTEGESVVDLHNFTCSQSVCVSSAFGSVSHSIVYLMRDVFDRSQVFQDYKDHQEPKERKEVHNVSPHSVSVTL